jgi:hypothetical protein
MNYFCTYCDQGYAARLVCLHDSLVASGEAFRLYVLCFDAATEAVVAGIGQPSLVAIPLAELLEAEPDYAAVRSQRTPVEFFFTTTPVLVRYCLQREPGADRMTYLDSDLFFFGPASAIFAEQDAASVGIVPHRFPPHLAERTKYGTYNVAWVSFARDRDGLACLEWWRERCLEWCHDYLDQGRFADQGYLDEFPRRFAGVRVLNHPGINAAPWNVHGLRITPSAAGPRMNDQPLLFYHFQGVRELVPGWFEPGLRAYQAPLTPELKELVYLPYLRALAAVQHRLRVKHGIVPRFQHQRLNAGKSWRDRWERLKARRLLPWYGRLRGQLLHAPEPEGPA